MRDRREGQEERQRQAELGRKRVEMGRVREKAGVWGQDGGASPPSEIDLCHSSKWEPFPLQSQNTAGMGALRVSLSAQPVSPIPSPRGGLTCYGSAWPEVRSSPHRLSESSAPKQGGDTTEKWRPKKENKGETHRDGDTLTPGWEKSGWGEARKRLSKPSLPSSHPSLPPRKPSVVLTAAGPRVPSLPSPAGPPGIQVNSATFTVAHLLSRK